MSKAEEIRYKAVIAADNQEPPKDYVISAYADHFLGFVEGYVEGYHQAEKDLELTWEDIDTIYNLLGEEFNYQSECGKRPQKEACQEALKLFKERKQL